MLQKNKGSSWLNAEPNFEKLKSILCTKSNVTYTNFLTSNILTISKFEGRGGSASGEHEFNDLRLTNLIQEKIYNS